MRTHNPSNRITMCALFAVAVHAVGLMGLSLSKATQVDQPPLTLNLNLISPPPQPSNASHVSASKSLKELAKPSERLVSSESQLKRSLQRKTHDPVVKRTISADNHLPQDTQYLARWQAKIEDIGNKNYPRALLEKQLHGSLRLMVSVNKDGSVKSISLRRSSGHKELDDAAIKIVQMSAPFEAFPPEIADSVDVLDIIRTWQFRGTLTSHS